MGVARDIRHRWLPLLAADVAAVAAAYYTTLLLRFHCDWGRVFFAWLNRALDVRASGEPGESFELFYQASAFRIILLVALTVCTLYALRNLYAGRRFLRPRLTGWNVLVANLVAMAVFYAYFYVSRNVFHPRSFFATLIPLNVLYCVCFRGMAERLLRAMAARGVGRCAAVLVGRGREADWIAGLLRGLEPHGVYLAEHYMPEAGVPFDAVLEEIARRVRAAGAGMVICAEPDLELADVMRLLEASDSLDVSTKVLSRHLEVLPDRAGEAVDRVHDLPLVHFEAPSLVASTIPWRRAVSTVLSVAGLLVLLPALGLLALLIRLSSRGPAVFVQERIGVNRRPFRMYKFRTMRDRAEEMLAQVEEFNESGTALFKMRRDPRVTPIGRFLRRFSLDELPQLWNVVRGEMVLVGPRPLPRRDFEGYYETWHYGRHNGMPGLTCLWQISGRSDLDFHNMCILDVYYLRNKGWLIDLRILLKTIWVVLFAKGAY